MDCGTKARARSSKAAGGVDRQPSARPALLSDFVARQRGEQQERRRHQLARIIEHRGTFAPPARKRVGSGGGCVRPEIRSTPRCVPSPPRRFPASVPATWLDRCCDDALPCAYGTASSAPYAALPYVRSIRAIGARHRAPRETETYCLRFGLTGSDTLRNSQGWCRGEDRLTRNSLAPAAAPRRRYLSPWCGPRARPPRRFVPPSLPRRDRLRSSRPEGVLG